MSNPSAIKTPFSNADSEALRRLVPLHTLSDDAFAELLDDLQIVDLKKGQLLFAEGDTDHVNYYLLQGKLALLAGGHVVDTLAHDSPKARFPVAHVLPRKNSVRATSKARIARLDSRRVSDLLARSNTVDYQVNDLEEVDASDWMTLMLRSPVLQQVPASNIQRVMMSVEQVEMPAGQDVIRQGDPGDYYYMLTKGQAAVRRDHGDGKGEQELARLGPGDAFGEEALLSDQPRNSSVGMLSAGAVLRLAKSDFVDLIQTPLSNRVNFDQAVAKVEKGAVWLDLRSQQDYEAEHLPGSINLPIESLRYQVSSLAPDRHYVLYSNSGGRAAVAAFLLVERGIDVSVLEGGLKAIQLEPAAVEKPRAVPDSVPGAEPDQALQDRLQAAEQHAQELERHLQAVKNDAQQAESDREQHLHTVKEAVEQARKKLLASEREKQHALEAQKQAYDDMEALTSNLEKLSEERAELADRMLEIEGLDRQLQKRLQKVERELIGERERAESASASLDELDAKLVDVMEERELERAQHAAEVGSLKEDMTALQLELEQAQSDLQTYAEKQAEDVAFSASEQAEQLALVQQDYAAVEKQRYALQRLVDGLQEEALEHSELLARREIELTELKDKAAAAEQKSKELQAQVDSTTGDQAQWVAERERLEQQLESALQAADEARKALTQVQADDQSRQQLSDSQLATLQAAHDHLMAEAAAQKTELVRLQTALETQSGDYQAQEEQLTEQREQLQAEVDALEQRHASALQSAEAQLAEAEQLAQQAAEERDQMHSDLLAARQDAEALEQARVAQTAELDSLRSQLETLEASQAQHAAQAEDQADLQQQMTRLQAELEAQTVSLKETEGERDAARNELMRVSAALAAAELAAADSSELEQLQARLQEATAQVERARELQANLQSSLEQSGEAADSLRAELAEQSALRVDAEKGLQARQAEVDELRSVMETYVDQLQNAQDQGGEVEALRAELEMVRTQAAKDVAEIRQQLVAAHEELQSLRSGGGREAVDGEVLRQKSEELEISLQERQRELLDAAEARQMLEDSLEDANAEVDALRRQLDKLNVEVDESQFKASEAEQAREQVQQELLRYQEDAEQAKVADMRDERMRPSNRPLDIDGVVGAGLGAKVIALLLGALLTLGALECWSFVSGHGELIGRLFN